MATPKFDGRRWRIQVQKDGKRYSFSSSTEGAKGRKECLAKYESWLYGEGSGQKSVGRVCEEYLEDLQNRRGAGCEAYIQNEKYIRLYIAPKFAKRKMCKMTLRDWQSVINEARGALGKPLSHKTLVNLRGIISGIVKFGYADYQNELLRGSLYIPKGHSKKEKEILTSSQIARLFEPSDGFWYLPCFQFLVITGMRPSEALGIQIGDIEGDCLQIRRAVNGRGIITEGKNENARRMIPLGQTAREILKQTIERNEKKNLRTEWVFCDIHGDKGNQSSMRTQWNRLKEERGLSGTIYSLRHTFISLMIKNSTLPESTLKDIVGHSVSMPTIGGTYDHIVEGESRKAAEIIDLTFASLGEDLGEDSSSSDGLSENRVRES